MDTCQIQAPSPEHNSSVTPRERLEDYNLEGIATNVKLILKLIQEHREASHKGNDDHKMQRMAGMVGILEDVRTRIQKSQALGKREAELRRCKTDVKNRNIPRDKKPHDLVIDEKEKLRKELNASLAARKSLEIMCSSLGKEKEIMASELSKKVHEVNELEELVNNLKEQNESLSAKVQTCAAEHKKINGREIQGNVSLQERNKELSKQLLRSLDSYKSLKRKLKEALKDNERIREQMDHLRNEIADGMEKIRGFKQKIASGDESVDVDGEISALQHKLESLEMKFYEYAEEKKT